MNKYPRADCCSGSGREYDPAEPPLMITRDQADFAIVTLEDCFREISNA